MEKKFLLPGEYHFAKEPMELGTLLGSCVALCLYNKTNGHAAMNHYLLPIIADKAHMQEDPGRYGLSSCVKIIKGLFTHDPVASHYTAQIFGGGNVTGHLCFEHSVGTRNIEIAEQIVQKYGIPVIGRDVGGPSGRKIRFNTATNSVESLLISEMKTSAEKTLAEKRGEIVSRKLKILIVDDSPAVRMLLRRAIETSRDMEVIDEAENPYDAREKLLLNDPDVILLDIIMPRMNGLDFLKKLSKHYPKPVVIVSTIAKAGSAIAEKAAQYGATEVIDKEKLELHQGMETVVAELLPRIKRAFIKFKPAS